MKPTKSYRLAIDQVNAIVSMMTKQKALLASIIPSEVYLYHMYDFDDKPTLIRIVRFRTYDAVWRNKMVYEVLASNHDTDVHAGEGRRDNVLLNETFTLTPVSKKEYALYAGMKHITKKFAAMLKGR
jgi:hypothetical protein